MACFFKFTDLAKIASIKAIGVPSDEWGQESRTLMGKRATARLENLQMTHLIALREILGQEMEMDEHSAGCGRRGMVEEVWKRKVTEVEGHLTPESELFELLDIDLRGGHCGECFVLLGTTIQRCLYKAKELPRSV